MTNNIWKIFPHFVVVHRTTAIIIFDSPTEFLVVLGLPDYHYFDPWDKHSFTQPLTQWSTNPLNNPAWHRSVRSRYNGHSTAQIVYNFMFSLLYYFCFVFITAHNVLYCVKRLTHDRTEDKKLFMSLKPVVVHRPQTESEKTAQSNKINDVTITIYLRENGYVVISCSASSLARGAADDTSLSTQ